MKPVLSKCQAGLLRTLLKLVAEEHDQTANSLAARQVPTTIVESIMSREWESLTFTGHRHQIRLRLLPPHCGVARLRDHLASSALNFPGYIVADIDLVDAATTDDGLAIVIDVMTIVDAA